MQATSASRSTVVVIRKAESEYFLQLLLNPRDPGKLWKAVKYLNKQQSVIPALVQDEITASTDHQKAEVLNTFFVSCFSRSLPALATEHVFGQPLTLNESTLEDILALYS